MMRRLVLALAGLCWANGAIAQATPDTVAASNPAETRGRGAVVPFVEYEAENAVSDGVVIGPDRHFTTIAAEASGRRAVRLDGQARFVEFTLKQAANAVTVRYAVPDNAQGTGLDATLGVYVEGHRLAALDMTSRYGWFYGAYPFTNRPADGRPHHVFDHARVMFGRTLPAGTVVRLAIGAEDRAPWYVIDLADFELVRAPLSRPPGAVSVVEFGADASGSRDSTAAFARAIATGSRTGRIVWVPPGSFRITRHLIVDRVTIAGAGPWYSVLRGKGVGLYGRAAPAGSRGVQLRDFAVIGEVAERKDKEQVNGIGGAMGGGTVIQNLWLQHHKVGLWFDGPMDGITVRDLRILDMTADGLNFHRGVSNALVENNVIRNVGDDGLAAWSHHQPDHAITFRNNTVISPVLANGIAIYGGRDITVEGNLVADTVTEGGGIHVGNRFDAVPVSGTIRIADNTILRGGSFDPRWRYGVGALWFYALDAPIDADIAVSGMDIRDSSEEALMFTGKPITGVTLNRVRIDGSGAHAVALRSAGAATFTSVTSRDAAAAGILDCSPGFRIVDGGGNSGLGKPVRDGCQTVP